MRARPTTDAIDLRGQVAVVTGGGRGLGRAFAQALAAAGAAVAVLARSDDELAQTVAAVERAGGRARRFRADVTDAAAVRTTMAAVERTLGPVDLLVNNAGVVGPLGPFWEADPEVWWRAVDVNLRGQILCAHALLPGMVARRRGRIVNVASGGGARAIPYMSAYVAGKTALIRFAECLAAETHEYGIAVFAVGPGTVRTAMSEYSLNSPEGQRWLPWFRMIFDEGSDSPPEHPARLVLSLASGRMDALSGCFLTIADDLDVVLARAADVERDKLYRLRVRTLDALPVAPGTAGRTRAERAAGLTLRVRRVFAASRERVFRVWIDPDEIAKWFLPPTGAHWIRPPEADPRPGGRFSLDLIHEQRDFHLYGTYRQVRAPERLVLAWVWDTLPILEGAGDTLVTVEFTEQGAGTEIVLTQEHLPSEAARAAFERGWARCFGEMAKLLL